MALILPERTNSLNLLHERLWAEQLQTIQKLPSSRWLWWASQQITLLVTGAAYSIWLIRDFVLLTLELPTVGVVVVWIDPCPGSGYLSSMARFGECQGWSDVEVWWPDKLRIWTERCCNQRLPPSVAQPDLGTSCSVSPPPGAPAAWVGPLFPPSWCHNTRGNHMYECPPAWKQSGLLPCFMVVPLWKPTHLVPISPSQI